MIIVYKVPYRFLITTFLNVSHSNNIVYDKRPKESLKTCSESSKQRI